VVSDKLVTPKVALARFWVVFDQSFESYVKLSQQIERSSETTYWSGSRMVSSSLFEGQSRVGYRRTVDFGIPGQHLKVD